MGRFILGFDIGSSSVKAALLEIETGKNVGSAFSPAVEMQMVAVKPGFAEQDPELWWKELVNATRQLQKQYAFTGEEVEAIGISYQMHGLVCIDKAHQPLRSSIIWCDSRAVDIGNKAFSELGEEFCLKNFLNSPGNFTASKLKWVKENEPQLYEKIFKILLPGDYIALKLTGEATTTISGLSEGILWNYRTNSVAEDLLRYYGIDKDLLCPVVPTFGVQGRLAKSSADILNLKEGIPVCYRAGDQPNNAFSLNVLKPGEIAATAGTSGVVYGITEKTAYDPASRVNTFVHVSYTAQNPRYGVLLCVNGTGILNSWLRKNFFSTLSYQEINAKAGEIPVGADGLLIYPFGNGAERILENKDPGSVLTGLQFNRHHGGHVARAAQEGIVFALHYGMSIMKDMGIELNTIRAGHANMFLSKVFAEAFANTSGCLLELYNTDGAVGAARAAGVGGGIYKSFDECFAGMEKVMSVDPVRELQDQYADTYQRWYEGLQKYL